MGGGGKKKGLGGGGRGGGMEVGAFLNISVEIKMCSIKITAFLVFYFVFLIHDLSILMIIASFSASHVLILCEKWPTENSILLLYNIIRNTHTPIYM